MALFVVCIRLHVTSTATSTALLSGPVASRLLCFIRSQHVTCPTTPQPTNSPHRQVGHTAERTQSPKSVITLRPSHLVQKSSGFDCDVHQSYRIAHFWTLERIQSLQFRVCRMRCDWLRLIRSHHTKLHVIFWTKLRVSEQTQDVNAYSWQISEIWLVEYWITSSALCGRGVPESAWIIEVNSDVFRSTVRWFSISASKCWARLNRSEHSPASPNHPRERHTTHDATLNWHTTPPWSSQTRHTTPHDPTHHTTPHDPTHVTEIPWTTKCAKVSCCKLFSQDSKCSTLSKCYFVRSQALADTWATLADTRQVHVLTL